MLLDSLPKTGIGSVSHIPGDLTQGHVGGFYQMLCDVDPNGSKFFPKGIACLRDHKALGLPRGEMERIGQIRKVQVFAVMLRNELMDQKTGVYDRVGVQRHMQRKITA